MPKLIRIAELESATALNNDDYFAISQNGVTKKVSFATLVSLICDECGVVDPSESSSVSSSPSSSPSSSSSSSSSSDTLTWYEAETDTCGSTTWYEATTTECPS